MGRCKGIVLSHKADLDGVASALIAREAIRYSLDYLETEIDVRFAHYDELTQALQQIAKDEPRCVYITDLSFSTGEHTAALRAVIEGELQPEVRVFDHHPSSRVALADLNDKAIITLVDDGTKCAADLVFDHFVDAWCSKHIVKPEASYIFRVLQKLKDAAHSRDLWIRDVVAGDELTAMIGVLGAQRVYDQLADNPLRIVNYSDIMRFSLELAQEEERRSYALAERSMYVLNEQLPDLGEKMSIITCLTSGSESQVGHSFIDAENPRLCVMLDTRKLAVSLRANPAFIRVTGVSAAEIAQEFGGGGHPPAAGMPDKGYTQRGIVALAGDVINYVLSRLEIQKIQYAALASGAGRAFLADK